ncbi:unnamed protein product, partial [Symbiodinium sp. CCMP2456]
MIRIPSFAVSKPASRKLLFGQVLLTEIARLRATFSQHLREHEVALSQLRSDNGHARSWARQDVELLRQQVQLMERQRRRRNFEVKKLRKAMKEVRNALFTETPPAAQGHLAAKQLLDEVRNERERRLAEKRYLEDQIKKLSDEVEEQQNAAPLVDHEKEKLKASVRQLKLSIESKDRYACWVCNRASHERQESGSDTEDSDRHEDECVMMRRRLVEMEEEIRLLTGGTAGSGLADLQSAAPSQASSQKPSARLSLEPPSIAESPMSPSSTLRPFRERVPTPWAEAGMTSVAEASVQFMDSITTVTSPEVPESVPEVGNRSVRDRISTPYVRATTDLEERRVFLAPALSTVEEFEAEGLDGHLRPTRDRMPTPHVSSQMIEETLPSTGKMVRILSAEIQ